MAINPINFLKEISTSSTVTIEQVKTALSYSKVGDCFDYDDWTILYYAEDISKMRDIVGKIYEKYQAKYFELGEPRTAEEWYSKMYSEVN